MKQLFYTLMTITLCFTGVSAQTLELKVGFAESNTGYDFEQKEKSYEVESFIGIQTTKDFFLDEVPIITASVSSSAWTDGTVDFNTLVHLNLLWVLGDVWKLLYNRDQNFTIIAGGGYQFSNRYYNSMDVIAEIGFSLKLNNFRGRVLYSVPLMERTYYANTHQLSFTVFHDFLPYFKRKKTFNKLKY